MIQIDPRAGSKDLVAPLLAVGLPVEKGHLEFGDLAFLGRGEAGAEVFIGIEHKKLPDLVQSLGDDRLAGHQLPGLVQNYDRPYLIIEGEFEVDSNDRVLVPTRIRDRLAPLKGCMPASVLDQRVLTLETRGGLRVRWTRTQKETVRYVSGLYRFWTDRDIDEHRSHLAIHAPDLDSALRIPRTLFQEMVAPVPDIGLKTGAAVEKAFAGSLGRALLAGADEWAEVVTRSAKGKLRRLGPSKANRIAEVMRTLR